MALGFAEALRNSMLDEISTRAGASALIRIYDGVRPATNGTATTLLAELTCSAAFAAAAAAGLLTMNAITSDTSADATGTATWFRIVQSDGSTHVVDGDVSTIAAGTGDMQLDDTAIVITGTVAISAGSFDSSGNA